MKTVFALLLVCLCSSVSHADVLNCVNSEGAWTAVRLETHDKETLSLTITETVDVQKANIGSVAVLKAKKPVYPGGRAFTQYKGTFLNGIPQKTLTIYVSEDLTVLTMAFRGSGDWINFSCR